MELSAHPLWEVVKKITYQPTEESEKKFLRSIYSYQLYIMTKDEHIVPTKLVNIHVERNYRDNFSDLIYMTVLLPSGVYDHKLYPRRDSLWGYLTREVAKETTDDAPDKSQVDGKLSEFFFYRLALPDPSSGLITAETVVSNDAKTSDTYIQNMYTSNVILWVWKS